ncbi:hypothetical protein [Streptomyces spinosus]|uniref:hypothetical protein n=1 Tax=Streptomyces spinosus TaxID=2872623 RepID=UPI001CECBABA|nr:hypothetical protein [Streptomyces spinosus]
MRDTGERARRIPAVAGPPPARPGGVRPLAGGPRRGDPVAGFLSLAPLDDVGKDHGLLAGHRDAGGRVGFGRSGRLWLALSRACRRLITLVETVPRAAGVRRRRWTGDTVGPEMVAALDEIKRLRLSS